MVRWDLGFSGPQRRRKPTRRAAARRIQKRWRMRKRRPKNKKITKLVKRVIHRQAETFHMDHKFSGAHGSTMYILPYGVDSPLNYGTACGDIVPVNRFDNIIKLTNTTPPGPGDPVRQGNEIFCTSIRVMLRVQAPKWEPALVASSTSVNRTSPEMLAKCRLLVVYDNDALTPLPVASTTTGVLSTIYDDLTFCTAAIRQLPTFKGYSSEKRYRVIHQRKFTLNGSTAPFRDLDFNIKVNKKITYNPDLSYRAEQAIYIFLMSDYPVTTPTIQTQVPPLVLSFWKRYYYKDM